jgi:hypothetical protein
MARPGEPTWQTSAVADGRVSVNIKNTITPDVNILVQGATLIQGTWTVPPSDWDDLVPWQSARLAKAEGPMPQGVQGYLAIRIGTMQQVSQLNFRNTLNTRSADIDGSQTKFIFDPDNDRIFVAEVHASTPGNPFVVELVVSGGTSQQGLLAALARLSLPPPSGPVQPPDSSPPDQSDQERQRGMSKSPNSITSAHLSAESTLQVRIYIANWIAEDQTMVLQDPKLINGQWVGEPPDNFSTVGWQEQQNYLAEGPMPKGVSGDVTLRISGGSGTTTVSWTRNLNQATASFNGQAATPGNPLKTTWQQQEVTLAIDVYQGNLMAVTLKIGNQQP